MHVGCSRLIGDAEMAECGGAWFFRRRRKRVVPHHANWSKDDEH